MQSNQIATISAEMRSRQATGRYSKAEWEARKETIKRLYLDEDRTLKEVMAVMVQEHEFYAT